MKFSKLQYYLLLTYAFTLVFESWNMMSIGGNSLPKLIGYVLIGSYIIRGDAFNWRVMRRFFIPVILFLSALFISILINYNKYGPISWYVKYQTIFLNFLFFILISGWISKHPKWSYGMLLALSSGIFIAATLFVMGYGVEFDSDGRMNLFGENSNKLGIFAVMASMLVISAIIENRFQFGKWRYSLILLLIPLINMIALTGSRVAFFGLLFSLMVFFIFKRKKSFFNGIVISLSGILLIVIVYYFLLSFDVLSTRISKTIETGDMAGRDVIWEIILNGLENNPVFGLGINGYLDYLPKVLGYRMSPHNVYLEVMAYGGLVALVIYLIFLFRILKVSYIISRDHAYVLPLVMVAFIGLVMGSGQGLTTKPFYMIFTYVIGEYLMLQRQAVSDQTKDLVNSP